MKFNLTSEQKQELAKNLLQEKEQEMQDLIECQKELEEIMKLSDNKLDNLNDQQKENMIKLHYKIFGW